jgi:hypothetical protein
VGVGADLTEAAAPVTAGTKAALDALREKARAMCQTDPNLANSPHCQPDGHPECLNPYWATDPVCRAEATRTCPPDEPRGTRQ